MSDAVRWSLYEFTVYPHETQWNNVGGIYIFAGLNQQNQWVPYYIGKADSFQNRIPSHEQWDKARSLGASRVHARTVAQETERDRIEAELIRAFQPRLNAQLR